MSVINSQPLIGASGQAGYFLDRSLRFRSSASAYLSRTPASAGNTTAWTISAWVKRGLISGSATYRVFSGGTGSTTYGTPINFINDTIDWLEFNGGVVVGRLTTTQLFRDPSAWYHIVCVWDSTNATSTNRMRMYVNGVQVTAFSSTTYPSSSASSITNNSSSLYLGVINAGGLTQYFDGYMTEVNFIDGQALTPSSFGETSASTGVWIPKKYTGTYGTNGFYLDFKDNSALTTSSNAGLGKDNSGNGNYWTTNNISITSGVTYDSMTDVPTLTSATAANYAVLNPLDKNAGTTPSNANLTWTASTPWRSARATFGMTTGKWYWEVTPSGANCMIGIGTATAAIADNNYPGKDANGWGYFDSNGNKFNNGTGTSYGASYTTNDVIGVAFDADNGTLTFYKNGTTQGTAFTGLTSGPYFPMIGNEGSTSHHNFGQRPFAYTPPTGFVALNTFNLPTPTIGATPSTRANKYFDATTYTGNGSTQTITNSGGFQPDFVWVKNRSTTTWNSLQDVIRGATKELYSNATDAEQTYTNTLTSFNSNGFSVGNASAWNGSGNALVAWQWRASNATGVTNTAGSITSTVSANTTAGFSIVAYTGNGTASTIGHGLGASPRMIIVKSRTNGSNPWVVYHGSLGVQFYTLLNSTAASANNLANYWSATTPSSTVFGVNTYGGNNANGENFVAYCFAEVAGYSRFGSYTGNGSADGPFVFCGFRPRYVMVKRSDGTGDWMIYDSVRASINAVDVTLYADLSSAELSAGTPRVDFLSNGFKLRNTGEANQAGAYIFAAFAEAPFKYSVAR